VLETPAVAIAAAVVRAIVVIPPTRSATPGCATPVAVSSTSPPTIPWSTTPIGRAAESSVGLAVIAIIVELRGTIAISRALAIAIFRISRRYSVRLWAGAIVIEALAAIHPAIVVPWTIVPRAKSITPIILTAKARIGRL
jgi:hypothetical protein